jgi:hypothetical protein
MRIILSPIYGFLPMGRHPAYSEWHFPRLIPRADVERRRYFYEAHSHGLARPSRLHPCGVQGVGFVRVAWDDTLVGWLSPRTPLRFQR